MKSLNSNIKPYEALIYHDQSEMAEVIDEYNFFPFENDLYSRDKKNKNLTLFGMGVILTAGMFGVLSLVNKYVK